MPAGTPLPAGRHPSDIAGLTRAAPLSRRLFMATSGAAAAGFTLAAGPVRADAIRTSAEGLDAADATVKVGDGDMPVYFARPEGVENPPVILVAIEVFGLHEYIKDVVRRLARLGAFAVAPDIYFRMGDLTKIDSIPQLLPLVNGKPDAELFADLDATAAFAKARGGDANRLGIIGFCRGGRTVWLYATHNAALKAGVSFYGSLMDPPNAAMPRNAFDLADAVEAPVLGLYGAEDQGIPPDQVRQMEARLKAAGKTVEFKIYPGAPHGFFADYRASYREEAARDAWSRAIAWFRTYGVLS
ncbi:MAG: dienelactone hydrolase family protein [Methylocella sp.]